LGSDGQELYEWEGGYLPRYVCGYGFGVYLEYDVRVGAFLEERYVDGALISEKWVALSG
jgi:hypothetical protein